MNFSDVLRTLNQASAFELYRMRAAIDRVLEQPHWLESIRSRLRVGQNISYFEPRANASEKGQIIELRRKHALVLEWATQKRWLIEYAAINIDGADVEIREQPRKGLGRNEVGVGDVVGYISRNHQQCSGRIIRLNDKTVTVQVGREQWRVSYSLLHRVVVGQAIDGEVLEITAPADDADGRKG